MNKFSRKSSEMYQSEKTDKLYAFSDFFLSIPVRLTLFSIRIYQWFLSPLKQLLFGSSCGCRFQPTCSCYAHAAFARFGFRKGLWFALRRILRCHPWHPGGFDPLPGIDN